MAHNRRLEFRIPDDYLKRIDEYIEGTDLSRSDIGRRAIENYLSVNTEKKESKNDEKSE